MAWILLGDLWRDGFGLESESGVGTVTLFAFFFGFEEAVIDYYEDIVNIVCLPIP